MAVALDAILARIKDVCKRNGLLILSVLSVTIGCLLGFFLRTRRLSQQDNLITDDDLVNEYPQDRAISLLAPSGFITYEPSLMSGLAALDAKTSSRLGIITVTYYLWTTFVAVVVGIIMVSIIHPGGAAQKESTEEGGKPIMSSADALLDLIRNMFPANLVEATFKQYRTRSIPIIKSNRAAPESSTRRIIVYGVQDENGSNVQNFALDITPPPEVIYKSEPGASDGMNVLGIVIFSATMALLQTQPDLPTHLTQRSEEQHVAANKKHYQLSTFSPLQDAQPDHHNLSCAEGDPTDKTVQLSALGILLWCGNTTAKPGQGRYFPFGIVFLIAGKILEMDDPSAIGKKLGFYAITVVCGLVVHGLFILPMMYFFITKKNPIVFIRGILQALLIALATSSSSATLPITFKCLLENNHVDRRIARFVLPVGATINMDGTALYEAVAAIFIAQFVKSRLTVSINANIDVAEKESKDFHQLITLQKKISTLSITATAASIGAAGIPQAGLVTMVIVLTSVGLPTDDITLIIAVDWALKPSWELVFFLSYTTFQNNTEKTLQAIAPDGIKKDRFRTMINVLGDALAAGIMAHICRKEFIKDGDEVPLICETKPINIHQIVAYQRNGCVKTMNESRGPETVKELQHHIPIQVEQEETPVENHTKKSNSKDHCTIEINELETNV
ncbi:Excitatory amino acid transporter 5 [Lonchura striata]|uniref:Amino acid transporter n=1 Tax=Lonchura striata TaxID=40157 RepID=A0A218VED2_9PASE|nr:Excitatory amino acid transporter 5 [Lonchura striata domestica]